MSVVFPPAECSVELLPLVDASSEGCGAVPAAGPGFALSAAGVVPTL